MALSYSGLTNYGKATLPSVESWSTNMNILRDPPKSVTTRKIDKVGETSVITQTIDESGDRFSEAINRYARGVNPMVSVSYSNHGTNANGGEAFLPYRIMRDGAFRPPSRRPEELLPLSRLPRIWTYMTTQKHAPDFTKRIMNCGTAENTRAVKNTLLKTDCESRQIIANEPGATAPHLVRSIVRDPLAPGQVSAAPSCAVGAKNQLMALKPITLIPNKPNTSAATNCSSDIYEHKYAHGDVTLLRNHPVGEATTNLQAVKEQPIVLNNINLRQNHPSAQGYTNTRSYGGEVYGENAKYTYLPEMQQRGGFEGRPGIPSVQTTHPIKEDLMRVR